MLGYRDVVPAREAVARTARWLADNPHPPGDIVERIMEDPFDYENEDRLIVDTSPSNFHYFTFGKCLDTVT